MKNVVTDNALEDQLIAKAAEGSPVFSQELHERIMQRVTHAPAAWSQHWSMWIPAAAAAGVLLAMGLSMHFNAARPNREIARALPSVPQIVNPVRVIDQPSLETVKFAYLDRDGAQVLDYMARQIDVIPCTK